MSTEGLLLLGRVCRALRARQRDYRAAESGFTLIELMVVLLIMGILMAIAIPTFLGVTAGANDVSTQSNLTNAMESAKAIFASNDKYPPTATMVADLAAAQPSLHFQGTASPSQTVVSVQTAATTGSVVHLAAWMTKTKVCWLAKDVETVSSTVGTFYNYNAKVGATGCKPTVTGTATWSSKYPIAPAGQ